MAKCVARLVKCADWPNAPYIDIGIARNFVMSLLELGSILTQCRSNVFYCYKPRFFSTPVFRASLAHTVALVYDECVWWTQQTVSGLAFTSWTGLYSQQSVFCLRSGKRFTVEILDTFDYWRNIDFFTFGQKPSFTNNLALRIPACFFVSFAHWFSCEPFRVQRQL